jgi:hypothetical protein
MSKNKVIRVCEDKILAYPQRGKDIFSEGSGEMVFRSKCRPLQWAVSSPIRIDQFTQTICTRMLAVPVGNKPILLTSVHRQYGGKAGRQ